MIRRVRVGLKQALGSQPRLSIFSVLVEPALRTAETKAVAPIIHVPHDVFLAGPGKLVRQHNLQVADGTLLEIVATCMAFELLPSFRRHADDMAGLVKQGMNWRIASDKDPIANNAGFRLAPEAAVYCLVARNQFNRKFVLSEQHSYRVERQIGN